MIRQKLIGIEIGKNAISDHSNTKYVKVFCMSFLEDFCSVMLRITQGITCHFESKNL